MLKFVRINSNFEPQYTINKLVPVGEKFTKVIESGTLYYQLQKCADYPELTFVSFGLNGHDQWWSSNSTTIKREFGIECIECSTIELKGEYPTMRFAGAVLKECVVVPDSLEWGDYVGSNALFCKYGRDYFPSRNDYFRSTHLDADGKLILPEPQMV